MKCQRIKVSPIQCRRVAKYVRLTGAGQEVALCNQCNERIGDTVGRILNLTQIQTVSADHKDTDGLVEELKKALRNIGVHMIDHPDYEGTDTYGFLISTRKLTKQEIESECINREEEPA